MGMNEFTGEIPSSYCSNWPNLVILKIFETYSGGEIPSTLSNCKSLVELNIAKNNFTGTLDVLEGLDKLQILHANGNQLEGDIDVILTFPLMKLLVLYSNKLSGTIPNEIDQLKDLVLIALNTNQFEGTIPSSFGNLSNLTAMYVINILILILFNC